MASDTIRFLIPQADWDALDSSHWGDYGIAPCHTLKLNGYILCTMQNLVPSKIALFESIPNVQKFEDVEDILTFQQDNPEVWGLES